MCNSTTENITYEIILEFAKTIEMFGLTPLEARLFVYLYLQDQPKSLDDMSEALGKSKTSMSTSIRNLSDANLVTLVWRKGVRKDLYVANNQLFKSFMNSYTNKWINATKHQKDALGKNQRLINQKKKDESSEELTKLDERLNDILEFHTLVENLFRNLPQE
ncbi:MAG TPA: transcriptional regulator [Virgibacillus sp.]|nr:transcriptional regulator [Virgibacillus sp.]